MFHGKVYHFGKKKAKPKFRLTKHQNYPLFIVQFVSEKKFPIAAIVLGIFRASNKKRWQKNVAKLFQGDVL